MADIATFRQRVRNREPLVGTFVKTPSYQGVEILGASGLDFIVLDAEHGPFDRADIDVCVMAARAAGLPALVRIPNSSAGPILEVLDVGAAGIVAPHARSVSGVQQTLAAARYRDGVRGFSNSPRAGGYGRLGMLEHIALADRDSVVVCQIEDRDAVEAIDAIAAIEEVDCLFLGRADLAVSYGVFDVADAQVVAAVERVCAACRKAGKAVAVFVGDVKEIPHFRALGASMFVVGSDQTFLRSGANALERQFRLACQDGAAR
jgi:2-keto-3-deoxy-L-rhamnonate aldolase RhmA